MTACSPTNSRSSLLIGISFLTFCSLGFGQHQTIESKHLYAVNIKVNVTCFATNSTREKNTQNEFWRKDNFGIVTFLRNASLGGRHSNVVQPKVLYGVLNEHINVTCSLLQEPTRQKELEKQYKIRVITVIHDEGPFGPFGDNTLQVTLYFSPLLRNDSALSHSCHGLAGDLMTAFQALNVTVIKRLPSPKVWTTDANPFSDATISLHCVCNSTSSILEYYCSIVNYHWLRGNVPIRPDARHHIVTEQRKSILTIRKVDSGIEGNYYCVVSKTNVNTTSTAIVVKVNPVISITPLALTKVEGESATFSCQLVSGNIGSKKLVLVTPGPEPTKIAENRTTFRNLGITNGNTSQIFRYQCLLILSDLKNPEVKSSLATLTLIKPSYPKCPSEKAGKVQWQSTAAGATDVQLCPGNATGQVTRPCVKGPTKSSKPTWGEPNVGNCTSIEFKNYLLQAEAIVSVDYTPSYNASGLLQVLDDATKSGTAKKKAGLNGGDIAVTIKILSLLVNNSQTNNNTDITSRKDQENFLEICSNCIEPKNNQSWIQFEDQRENDTKALWVQLVITVDRYGFQLTNQMEPEAAFLPIETTNMVMRLDRVNQKSEVKKKGLKFVNSKFQSSLFLPAEVFSNSKDHQVVSLVYKTLNTVMRLKNNSTVDQSDVFSSNTTMVTSSVSPAPAGKFQEKVKIMVENKRSVEPVPPRTCVFWREGLPGVWGTEGCTLVASESNQHVTTCECDHLTVFAVIMDPYGGPIPEEHRKALELISTIGCAISLFAVLLTILVTFYFWKSLKSPRTIVLMNICVAIAVVCILVVAEGTARDTEVGCTVMAVLLHYFLLAVFCWMLCEGVLLYLLIVKVVGASGEENIKFFLLFGWGFPLLIVGISLAVTEVQGYGYYVDQTTCWLAVGLIWSFVAPAIVVLLINIVVFILVIRQMMSTRKAQTKSRDEKLRMGVKATAVILPLLGITWLFGLLAFNSATLAFKYIFAIFNSLQGLMIFIFHCLLNPQVQQAFARKFSHSVNCSADLSKSKSLRERPLNEFLNEETLSAQETRASRKNAKNSCM